MSIDPQGSDRLACVCRCSNGLPNAWRPAIHIFAGENVCIQAITPMQASSVRASRQQRRIASAVVSTGCSTIRTGIALDARSAATTAADWSATWRSVSSP